MQRTLSVARQTLSVVRRRTIIPVRGMAGGKYDATINTYHSFPVS